MRLLLLIATLANLEVFETSGASPSTLAEDDAAVRARQDLARAVRWFAEDYALPALASLDVGAYTAVCIERVVVAVQARGAMLDALDVLLRLEPPEHDAAEDMALRALITQNAGEVAPVLLRLVHIASADFDDYLQFLLERRQVRPTAEQWFDALRHLAPLAAQADIPLLTALVGLHAEPRPNADVFAVIVRSAEFQLLNYRRALHATLRAWDPTWVPTVAVPEWTGAVEPLDLRPDEIASLAALVRDPPRPTRALRRALQRS
jgi:hypothetical protein